MTLPEAALEIMRARLTAPAFSRAVSVAAVFAGTPRSRAAGSTRSWSATRCCPGPGSGRRVRDDPAPEGARGEQTQGAVLGPGGDPGRDRRTGGRIRDVAELTSARSSRNPAREIAVIALSASNCIDNRNLATIDSPARPELSPAHYADLDGFGTCTAPSARIACRWLSAGLCRCSTRSPPNWCWCRLKGVERFGSASGCLNLGLARPPHPPSAPAQFRNPRSLIAELIGTFEAPTRVVTRCDGGAAAAAVIDESLDEPWCATLAAHLGHYFTAGRGTVKPRPRAAATPRHGGFAGLYASLRYVSCPCCSPTGMDLLCSTCPGNNACQDKLRSSASDFALPGPPHLRHAGDTWHDLRDARS